MSQAELAERVSVSIDHVSKIERLVYAPSLEMAARFVRALELDANDLIEAKPSSRKVSRRRLETEAALQRLVEKLDERTLDAALDIVGALAKHARPARG